MQKLTGPPADAGLILAGIDLPHTFFERNRMKKIILAVAVAAVASLAVASFASAGVARYQEVTGLQVTSMFNGATYVHNYVLTNSNTCGDGSFSGTGVPTSVVPDEAIHGTLSGQNITISGLYPNSYLPDPGYTWSYSGPVNGGGTYHDSRNQNVTLSFKLTTTNYANHGDYVSSQGGGSHAAHSCIGMPIH